VVLSEVSPVTFNDALSQTFAAGETAFPRTLPDHGAAQSLRSLWPSSNPEADHITEMQLASTERGKNGETKMFTSRATLIGYLAQDAGIRITRNGMNFTVLTLATTASGWPSK